MLSLVSYRPLAHIAKGKLLGNAREKEGPNGASCSRSFKLTRNATLRISSRPGASLRSCVEFSSSGDRKVGVLSDMI